MNNRSRTLAILNYRTYDRLPIVHFGFWRQTLEKWAAEGHLSAEAALGWQDNNSFDSLISNLLGFDYNWNTVFDWNPRLDPPIEERVISEHPNGARTVLNKEGMIVLEKPGVASIPSEIDHLLKGRYEWEEIFRPRLLFDQQRIQTAIVSIKDQNLAFDAGGRELLLTDDRQNPYGLYCGSLLGIIRNWLGLVGLSYMIADDEVLLSNMIETVAELCYQGVKEVLETGVCFDFIHFWEDICYKNGPLVNPSWFASMVAPHYKRITDLARSHGISIASLDSDGKIDALIPIWLKNGVNTMFPIEVGTWNASILPWREAYGRELRGVGGVRKSIFSQDYAAIDAEIERLRPLVDLGGYIPCPDHRISQDARWENVQYYCDRMRQVFS